MRYCDIAAGVREEWASVPCLRLLAEDEGWTERTHCDELKTLELAASAETLEGLLNARRSDAVRYIHNASELLERFK